MSRSQKEETIIDADVSDVSDKGSRRRAKSLLAFVVVLLCAGAIFLVGQYRQVTQVTTKPVATMPEMPLSDTAQIPAEEPVPESVPEVVEEAPQPDRTPSDETEEVLEPPASDAIDMPWDVMPEVESEPELSKPTVREPDSTPPVSQITDTQKNDEALHERIDRLEMEVQALRQALEETQEQTTKERGVLQLFALFKQQVLMAQPYRTELHGLLESALLSDTLKGKLRWFETYEKQGVISQEALALEFRRELARFYRGTGQKTSQDTGEALRNWLGTLVTVRKVGDSHRDDSDGSILARLEVQVEKRQWKLALDEVRRLSVRATPHFDDWMRKVHAHVESRQLLRSLERDLFGAL